jgi:hypothetical protein
MELSPSWEAANWAATQEIPNIFWNPNVYCPVLKSPPLVPIHSQINPVQSSCSISLRSILLLSTRLRLGLPSGIFLLVSHKYPTHSSSLLSCYIPCSSHSPWLRHSNYTWKRVHVMKHYFSVFSNLLSLHLSSVQIFFSTPCSHTPSVYIPPLIQFILTSYDFWKKWISELNSVRVFVNYTYKNGKIF